MNVTKENCRKVAEKLRQYVAEGFQEGHLEEILQFLEAVEQKLPTEESYKKAAYRNRTIANRQTNG